MFDAPSFPVSIIAFLYLNVAAINLNVFVYNVEMLRNRAMLWAVLNPFSLISRRKTELSIISAEMRRTENFVYRSRTVLLEKTNGHIKIAKCSRCKEVPTLTLRGGEDDNVYVECPCGKCRLPDWRGRRFVWPYPKKMMGMALSKKYSKGIQSVMMSCIRAIVFHWNKCPDMSKRDDVLVSLSSLGFDINTLPRQLTSKR